MSDWRAKALELFPELQSDVRSTDSLGELWVDLSARFRNSYTASSDSESVGSPAIVRAICLYAIWCTRSDSFTIQEPALIEFYENLPRFALQCRSSIYKRIIHDFVFHLGIAEIEKHSSTVGALMAPDQKKKFFADVSVVDREQQKRSRKR